MIYLLVLLPTLEMETHKVPQLFTAVRLQEYGVGIFELYPTKSSWKKAIKKGQVYVNGTQCTTGTLIVGGEEICLRIDDTLTSRKEFRCKLAVLYEDDYLAVIRKPAGVLVSGNSFKTVVNALPENLQESTQEGAVMPQPIHRLDYATTGLLLIGKTSGSIRNLNVLFTKKRITKTYLAITIGEMKRTGIVSEPIDGKLASSEYEVLQTVASDRFERLNLVVLSPITGRRHQLRKHMAFHGNHILGDRDYSPEGLLLKGKGMYLHANRLEFMHPFKDALLKVTDEIPQRFRKIFPETE